MNTFLVYSILTKIYLDHHKPTPASLLMAKPRKIPSDTPISDKHTNKHDGKHTARPNHGDIATPRTLSYPAPEFQTPLSLRVDKTTSQWFQGQGKEFRIGAGVEVTPPSSSRQWPQQENSPMDLIDPKVAILADMEKDHPDIVAIARHTWAILEPKLIGMYPTDRALGKVCPHVPRSFFDYLEHLTEFNKAKDLERTHLKGLQTQYASQKFPPWKLDKPVSGKKFGTCYKGDYGPGNYSMDPPTRGLVLAQHTIWKPMRPLHGPPWRPNPEWPSDAELRWEGDQRVATENGRYGRFPPIPRQVTDNPIDFHQREAMKAYAFDKVWPVPQMDDIYLPVDEIPNKIVPQLLDSDILAELECSYTPLDPRSEPYTGVNIGAVHAAELLNNNPFSGF